MDAAAAMDAAETPDWGNLIKKLNICHRKKYEWIIIVRYVGLLCFQLTNVSVEDCQKSYTSSSPNPKYESLVIVYS